VVKTLTIYAALGFALLEAVSFLGENLGIPNVDAVDRLLSFGYVLGFPVAVIPFDNISEDPANEFFCDGVTEEILFKLWAFKELNVIGRTPAFAFKGSGEDLLAHLDAAIAERNAGLAQLPSP